MIEQAEFQFEGGRNGVLLIHGLTGTPAEMRLFGKGLNRAGFTVHGMQLAGHCGSEADLLASGWRDWYASVEAAAAQLRPRVDNLFVAGLSMGALLALMLAEEQPQWVDGVGVLGVTFRYDGWSTPRIGRLSFMLPLLKGSASAADAASSSNRPTVCATNACVRMSVPPCTATTAASPDCSATRGTRWPICTRWRRACGDGCRRCKPHV